MKKILAILLVLVLTLCTLSVTVFADDPEKPAEVDESAAAVKVTSNKDDSVFYFGDLDQTLVNWVCFAVPGDKTITLMKDISLSNVGSSSARFIVIPGNLDQWHSRAGTTTKLIFDLNKKTLTYTGPSNLFYVDRFGFTIKNGTISYNGEGGTRNIVAIGTSSGRTATTSGSLWTPAVTFEKVNAFNMTEEGGSIVRSCQYAPKVTVKDSTFWTAKSDAIYYSVTSQEGIGSATAYEGAFEPATEITNSTIVSGASYPIGSTDPITVVLTDTALVTNSKTEKLFKDGIVEIEANVAEPEVEEGWSDTVAGVSMSGIKYAYGLAGELPELPFTDVKQGDWFYSFVQDLYFKNVVDGMTATTFVPDGTLTYGQSLKLITLGIGESEPAKDGAHWASGYLKLAKDKGWISGDVNLDASISRLAFCQIAAKAKGLTEQPAENPFTDTSDPAVLALNKAEVIGGMGDGKFAPDATLTRAQISKIVSLLSEL